MFDQDEIGVNKALTTLQRFSLITIRDLNNNNKEQEITVHSLVQKACLVEENKETTNDKSLHNLLKLIAKTEEDIAPLYNNHTTKKKIATLEQKSGKYSNRHLVSMCNNESTKEDAIKIFQVMDEKDILVLCQILYDNYHFKELISIAKKIVLHKSSRLNLILGDSYLELHHTEEALNLYECHVVVLKERFGEDHIITIDTQFKIAICYRMMGRVDVALKQYCEYLSWKTLTEDYPFFSQVMHNIALCYQDIGKDTEAFEIFKINEAVQKKFLEKNTYFC